MLTKEVLVLDKTISDYQLEEGKEGLPQHATVVTSKTRELPYEQ